MRSFNIIIIMALLEMSLGGREQCPIAGVLGLGDSRAEGARQKRKRRDTPHIDGARSVGGEIGIAPADLSTTIASTDPAGLSTTMAPANLSNTIAPTSVTGMSPAIDARPPGIDASHIVSKTLEVNTSLFREPSESLNSIAQPYGTVVEGNSQAKVISPHSANDVVNPSSFTEPSESPNIIAQPNCTGVEGNSQTKVACDEMAPEIKDSPGSEGITQAKVISPHNANEVPHAAYDAKGPGINASLIDAKTPEASELLHSVVYFVDKDRDCGAANFAGRKSLGSVVDKFRTSTKQDHGFKSTDSNGTILAIRVPKKGKYLVVIEAQVERKNSGTSGQIDFQLNGTELSPTVEPLYTKPRVVTNGDGIFSLTVNGYATLDPNKDFMPYLSAFVSKKTSPTQLVLKKDSRMVLTYVGDTPSAWFTSPGMQELDLFSKNGTKIPWHNESVMDGFVMHDSGSITVKKSGNYMVIIHAKVKRLKSGLDPITFLLLNTEYYPGGYISVDTTCSNANMQKWFLLVPTHCDGEWDLKITLQTELKESEPYQPLVKALNTQIFGSKTQENVFLSNAGKTIRDAKSSVGITNPKYPYLQSASMTLTLGKYQ